MDTRIYIMTHKQYEMPLLPGYHTLQVGAAIHPPLPYEKDNTGDNISAKNASYCELTGLYWLYRNVTCDSIGLCHYRRYFAGTHFADPHFAADFPAQAPDGSAALQPLTVPEAESLLSRYDILLPASVDLGTSVYRQFLQYHSASDLLSCRDVIAALAPDYLSAFDAVMNQTRFNGWNMFLTHYPVFRAYCDWLFPILEETEQRIHPENRTDYQQRIMGFLGERLLQVWLLMQPLRIYDTPCYTIR